MAGQVLWVYGPPGTGKTTYITETVKQVVDPHFPKHREPREIVLTSFTKAAAVNLQGNKGTLLPERNIGTLHAICAHGLGLDLERIAENHIKEWNNDRPQYTLQKELGYDLIEGDQPSEDTSLEEVLGTGDKLFSKYNFLRAIMLDREEWPSEVIEFGKAWESWKNDNDMVDFTDFIELALDGLPNCPGNPALLFVDEYQDLSVLEQTLIDNWAASAEMTLKVGDPDQVLYRFKGVDPQGMVRPDVDARFKKVLDRSKRVPQAVHALAVDWISNLPEREPISYYPTEQPGRVVKKHTITYKNPEGLLDILEKCEARNQQVMIQASCSYMLKPITEMLRREGVPFANPYRLKNGGWNPLGGGRGVATKDRLLAYFRPSIEVWGKEARLWNRYDLKLWASQLEAKGTLIRGAKQKLEEFEKEKSFDEVGIEELLTLFEEKALMDLMSEPQTLAAFWDRLTGNTQKKFSFPARVAQARGPQALKKEPGIWIGTIHSFKGTQAAVNIVFPDLSWTAWGNWNSPGPGRDDIIRQFYVAFTRTQDTLVMPGAASGQTIWH